MSSIKKYINHNNNVICDVCGRKRKASETTLAFGSGITAIVVSCLDGCADKLHPLNYPPPVIFDGRPVPNARPDSTEVNNETFISSTFPSFMYWGSLKNSGQWGNFNNPNNEFNVNGIWYWGYFRKV